MFICNESNGIYESNIQVQNREIEDRDVTELVTMGIVLTKIDIMVHEIKTIRSDCTDYAQMYKVIEDRESGNIMRCGAVWRSRAMKTLKLVLLEIIQGGNMLEAYETHKNVLENFIQMNQKNEKQEYIGIGWAETYDKNVMIRTKITKKDSNHIDQRVEIYQTKTRILKENKENKNLGKMKIFIWKSFLYKTIL